MKKRIAVMCTFVMLAITPAPILAASLDDVINQQQEQTTANEVSAEVQSNNTSSGSVLDDIASKANLEKEHEITKKVASPLYIAASVITQCLYYIIVLALPVQVLANLGFITIPFLRMGGPAESNMIGQNGMNNGMNAGMGYGNRYGAGGMGMGYGSRYGAGGMGYGAGMGMNSGMGMNGAAGQPIMKDKFIVIPVSENVIAIANSQVKTIDKVKEYVKDSVITVVAASGIGVLMITGVLTKLGLIIGNAVGNAITSAGGMI